MNKWCVFIIFLTAISCGSKKTSNPAIPTVFKYSEKYLLEWSDFKGTPKKTIDIIALTNSGIKYYFEDKSINNKLVINFNVYSFFDGNKSWKLDGKVDQRVLQHEQFHFLISEVNARLLREKLKKFIFTDNYEEEIKEIFNESMAVHDVMQHFYDGETKHSNDTTNQKLWEKGIIIKLYDLYDYTDETFVIKTDVPISYSEVMAKKMNRSF
jgi:hypothetical protein